MKAKKYIIVNPFVARISYRIPTRSDYIVRHVFDTWEAAHKWLSRIATDRAEFTKRDAAAAARLLASVKRMTNA